MLHQDRAGSTLGLALGLRSWSPVPASRGYAEAGVLPSSKLHPRSCRRFSPTADPHQRKVPEGFVQRCARESDSPDGARFESRLQKLVRRIFLVKTAHEATRSRND